MFWPGITDDIKALICNCAACQKFQPRQPAKTLRNELPTIQPWTCLATDISEYGGKSYLIVVDRFSKFIVVHKVSDHSSEQTVAAFLQILVNLVYQMKSVVTEELTLATHLYKGLQPTLRARNYLSLLL